MATTQYLHLNKPTGSDLVNPLTDTFPNWDLVDNAYHGLDSRAIGHATELVSQGVHAITRVDQYAKTFKFIATANYEAGETFTVDGIQVNAYTPSGSALASGSYVSGAVVIASLNADDSAITIYVSGQQTADNSLRLGGQLPSYYATQSEVDGIDTDVTNLKNLTGNTSIVGIGDGTTTGAISSLNADLNDIKEGGMLPKLNYGTPLHTFNTVLTFTATKTCVLCGTPLSEASPSVNPVTIDGTEMYTGSAVTGSWYRGAIPFTRLEAGDTVTVQYSAPRLHVLEII